MWTEEAENKVQRRNIYKCGLEKQGKVGKGVAEKNVDGRISKKCVQERQLKV